MMKWVILAVIFIFITQLKHIKFSVRFGESLISQFTDLFRLPASPRQLPPGSRDVEIEEPQLPQLPPIGDPPRKNEPAKTPKHKEDKRRKV